MKRSLFALISLLLFVAPAFAKDQRVNCVSVTPTLSASPDYQTGDSMGTEMTFPILNRDVGSGIITSILITDKAAQAVDLDLEISNASLSGTTFTDNGAFAPASTDLAKMLAPVNFGSASRFAFSANSVHFVGSLAMGVSTNPPSENIYAHLIARGAFNAATTSDVTVTICVARD